MELRATTDTTENADTFVVILPSPQTWIIRLVLCFWSYNAVQPSVHIQSTLPNLTLCFSLCFSAGCSRNFMLHWSLRVHHIWWLRPLLRRRVHPDSCCHNNSSRHSSLHHRLDWVLCNNTWKLLWSRNCKCGSLWLWPPQNSSESCSRADGTCRTVTYSRIFLCCSLTPALHLWTSDVSVVISVCCHSPAGLRHRVCSGGAWLHLQGKGKHDSMHYIILIYWWGWGVTLQH